MIPPYHLRDHPADLATEGPAQWLSPSLPAPKGLSISRGTGHYRDHAIELHPDAKLPRGRTFPLSPAEQKELNEFLRENLVNGQIHLSKSPIGAPVFFIKKKEGSLHLVQDYQKLNEIMVKNCYSLPLVSDVLTRLCNAEWFTTLDLHWASTMSD